MRRELDKKYIKGLLEEILYIWAEPINLDELSKIIEMDKKHIKEAIDEMQSERENNSTGLIIKNYSGYYQFTTRKETASYIERLLPKNRPLGKSSLETLSIIAYRQPITKVEIDNIRGVSSQSSITRLLELNLIKKAGRLNTIGKPVVYKTTYHFLEHFGLENIKQLPKLQMETDDEVE